MLIHDDLYELIFQNCREPNDVGEMECYEAGECIHANMVRLAAQAVIAYNKDYKSFEFLAEAISRLLLCNVVVCNAGYYGDSLAYSPYKKDYKRTVYKAAGSNIFTSQVICLPVKELEENQTSAHEKYQHGALISSNDYSFKWPPGYSKLVQKLICHFLTSLIGYKP